MKFVKAALLAIAFMGGEAHGWKTLHAGASQRVRDLTSDDDYVEFFFAVQDTGCLIVKDSKPRDDQKLMLGTCGLPNQVWKYDNGLLRTRLDAEMCMQAGRKGTPHHGKKLRLFSCNRRNDLQMFEYDKGVIKLASTNLCVVYRGVHADVNIDPIILVDCDEAGGRINWNVGTAGETLTKKDFEELDLVFDEDVREITFDYETKDRVGGGLEGTITFEDDFISISEDGLDVLGRKCVTVDDALASVFINFDVTDVTWETSSGVVDVKSATLTLERDPDFCEDDVGIVPVVRRLAERVKAETTIKRDGL